MEAGNKSLVAVRTNTPKGLTKKNEVPYLTIL